MPWIFGSFFPRYTFSMYYSLWQSVLLSYIFLNYFEKHFVFSFWLLNRGFSLIFLYKCVCFFIFARSEIHYVISHHPFIYVLGLFYHKLWLSCSRILSLPLSDFSRDSIVLFNTLHSLSRFAFHRLYNGFFSFACG